VDRNTWFEAKWRWLRRFAIAAAIGALLAFVGLALDVGILAGVGVLALVPWLIWVFLLPILHWKDRYIGERSDMWGAFLVLETSSWSKLVYWFRHILPDRRRAGRYRDAT